MSVISSLLMETGFKGSKGVSGPLSPLSKSKYQSSTYRYPIDLGRSDTAHYMIININEQRNTNYGSMTDNTTNPTAISNNSKYGSAGTAGAMSAYGKAFQSATDSSVFNTAMGGVKSAWDTISGWAGANGGDKIVTGADGIKNFAEGGVQGGYDAVVDGAKNLATGSIRAEKRILDTIALYMPDTLNFSQQQNWDSVSAGGGMLAAAATAGQSVVDTFANKSLGPKELGQQIGRNLSPFLLNMAAKAAGGFGQAAFQQAFGLVQNPMMEVLYTSPNFRDFRFDFMFYPRSESEAQAVQQIIYLFRFHQAPEIDRSSSGFFLVPPSEFDISFYYNGKINPNIPPISTCVLTTVDVDYAPSGFSAYEVPGSDPAQGGTGMPVAIRLSLGFKETEMVTKEYIKNEIGGIL